MGKADKLVLVTGATGLVGRSAVSRLQAAGYRVRGHTSDPAKVDRLQAKGCQAAVGDVTDAAALERAAQGCWGVVHSVGLLVERSGLTYESINHQGTVNAVRAAEKAGAERFILISVVGLDADDSNPYMVSKWRAEEAVRRSAAPWTLLRASYIYGPGGPFFGLLQRLARLPVVPVVGSGRQRFQMVYAGDVGRAAVAALGNPSAAGKIYDVGGPDAIPYDRILDAVAAAQGLGKRPKLHLPAGLVWPFVRLGGFLRAGGMLNPVTMEVLLRDNVGDITPLRDELGIEPVPFEEGLGRTFRGEA